jgi:hypothetical protein
MAQIFWQRVFDPQAYAAQIVNNSSYRTGASHMATAAQQSDIDAFMQANPNAQHFRTDMINALSTANFQGGVSNWQMLSWAYGEAVKNVQAREKVLARAKKAGKAVGGAPSAGRPSRSAGGGSTTDAIVEAINAQRGTV